MTFEVFQIPHDEDIVPFWMERIKAFRLFSLKTSPESFLSTYEREAAFTDDVWYGRLTDSRAFTFVALQADRIVATISLLGPLPYLPEQLSPLGNPWVTIDGDATVEEPTKSHYRINGMFTSPLVRGQGIAKALIKRSQIFGTEQAAFSGKSYVGSIAVDKDNVAAKNLYEKCGYVVIKEETMARGSSRTILLMKYTPEPKGSA